MKQKILIPSAVISLLSLSVGSFILSLDRIKSIENTSAQDQKHIKENHVVTKQVREQFNDRSMAVETSGKGERVRMGYHERTNGPAWEEQFIIPADGRFKQRGIWI